MQLKEYPEIQEDGKVVVTKTTAVELVQDFSEQMQERGNTNIVFFANRQRLADEVVNDDYPSGAMWSQDFTPNDMLSLVLTYANASLDPRQKLLFSSQLQNALLTEAMTDEYEYEEGYDEDYEDE